MRSEWYTLGAHDIHVDRNFLVFDIGVVANFWCSADWASNDLALDGIQARKQTRLVYGAPHIGLVNFDSSNLLVVKSTEEVVLALENSWSIDRLNANPGAVGGHVHCRRYLRELVVGVNGQAKAVRKLEHRVRRDGDLLEQCICSSYYR